MVSSNVLRQADARARDEFGIEPLQLMEVAGWQVARFVEAFMGGVGDKRVLVVAGAGNNGGDARRLFPPKAGAALWRGIP